MTDAMGRETNFWNVSIENGLVTSGLLYVLASWERFWEHQNVVLENVFRQLASVTHSRFPLMSHAYIPNVFSSSSLPLLLLLLYALSFYFFTVGHVVVLLLCICVKRLQQTNIHTFMSCLSFSSGYTAAALNFILTHFVMISFYLSNNSFFVCVYIYIHTYIHIYIIHRETFNVN